MHSLHIIGSRAGGGAEAFFCRLVRALSAHGASVSAIVRPGSWVSEQLGGGVRYMSIGMRGGWDLWARYRIGRAVRRGEAAIVQTYLGRATRLTRIAATGGGVHVARLGGYYDLEQYRHAHAWVANTRGLCDYLVRHGFPAARVFHIGNFVMSPPPIDAEQLAAVSRQLGVAAGDRLVLAVGRLHPVKGLDTLLRAYAQLRASEQAGVTRLVLVGAGPERAALECLAAELGIARRVHFCGWQADPSPYYRLADLLVSSSRQEALGNTILEAWAHGLPVVATATAGTTELIRDGETGLRVPINDVAALAAALRALLADPGARARLGEAGRRKVCDEFSPGAIVAAYLALYEHLAA
ncbi:MAG: glycosyltransferase [Gammaproteobacteria bacterium]